MERLNQFLIERTGGEKYATVFYCLLEPRRALQLRQRRALPAAGGAAGGRRTAALDATGMPVGLMERREIRGGRSAAGARRQAGGLHRRRHRGAERGRRVLRQEAVARIVAAHAANSCQAIHDAIQEGVAAFTEGAAQSDDITVVVLDFFENVWANRRDCLQLRGQDSGPKFQRTG